MKATKDGGMNGMRDGEACVPEQGGSGTGAVQDDVRRLRQTKEKPKAQGVRRVPLRHVSSLASDKPSAARYARPGDVSRLKATNEELVSAYSELASLEATAKRFGMCAQSVHERLTKLGVVRPVNVYTLAEEQAIRDAYSDYKGPQTIKALCALLGRNRKAVQLHASRMGLGDSSRPRVDVRSIAKGRVEEFIAIHDKHSDKELCVIFGVANRSSISHWRKVLGLAKPMSLRWEHTPHPRGMKGKPQTEHAKQQVSRSTRARWEDPSNVFNSDAFRQAKSDRMSIAQAAGVMRNQYSRGSMGRRADLGDTYFRSSWEANYARYLNFLIKTKRVERWEYEPDTFWFEAIRRGVRSYKPDFKIWEVGKGVPYYVEIKGWMDPKSKTKLKRMRKYHPSVRIVLVGPKEYRALTKQLSRLIPHWETKAARNNGVLE